MKSFVLSLIAAFSVTASLLAQDQPAAADPAAQGEVIDASNLDALRAKVGSSVVVEGMVTKVGTTKEGGITFINLGLPAKQGFVAVVFKSDYGAFPEGFDKFRNQKVRVTGLIKLYRSEIPEIEVKTPDQLTIVAPTP